MAAQQDISRYLEALFAHCEAEDDYEIAVSWTRDDEPWRSRGFDGEDLDQVEDFLTAKSEAGDNTYVGIARRMPGTTTEFGRGARADVIDMPALVADLDWRDAGHRSSDGRPSEAVVREIVDALPVEPGIIINTGGGLHIYVLLNEALDPSKPEHADLLLRWKAEVVRLHQLRDVVVDRGVLADPVRVLRPPQTMRRKVVKDSGEVIESQVALEKCETSTRWSLDDLDARLPAPSAESLRAAVDVDLSTITPEAREALAARPPVQSEDWDGDDSPNARARELRDEWVIQSLETLAAVRQENFNEVLFRTAAQLYGWVAGTGLSEDWAQAALEAECVRRWGQPDRADRTTIRSGKKAGMGSPREWPRGSRRISEPAAPEVKDVVLADGREVAVLIDSLAAAMEHGAIWRAGSHSLPGGGSVSAIYNPRTDGTRSDHGVWVSTWKATKDGEGEVVDVHVSDYIVRRTHERTTALGRGEFQSLYRCEVIDRTGRRWPTGWLAAQDSLNPLRVVSDSRARVAAPTNGSMASAVLRGALGVIASDEMVTEYPVEQGGWGEDVSGRVEGPVYYGLTASMTADGPRPDVVCELPPSDGEVDRQVVSQKGWPEASDEIGRMVEAWLSMSPEANSSVPGIVLGLYAMAPTRSQQKGSVYLVGKSDAGKTVLMRAGRALCSDVPWRSRSWTVDLTKDSNAGARIWARHCKDDVVLADDLATGDGQQARWAVDFVDEQTKSSMGEGDGGARSKGDSRTLSGTESAGAPLLVSMERLPVGQGIANRALHLRMHGVDTGKPTLDLTSGGGVDRFRDEWANTGRARAAWGGYLQWLARQVRDRTELAPRGTLASLAEQATARWDREYERLSRVLPAGTTRAVELAASIALGWRYLESYALELGQEELIPSMGEVDEWLIEVVQGTRAVTGGMSAGVRVVQAIAGALATGEIRVERHGGGRPLNETIARAMGWIEGTHGKVVGKLSKDGSVIVLNTGAPELARRLVAELRNTPLDEIKDRLADEQDSSLLYEGSTQVKRTLGVGSMRGFPIPTAKFGIDISRDELDLAAEEMRAESLEIATAVLAAGGEVA